MIIRIATVLLWLCLIALLPQSALAQGFMVKPMRLDVMAAPGRTIEVPIEIRNTAGGQSGTILLRTADITQASDGGWKLVEPGSDMTVDHSASALAWVSLVDDEVEIAPLEPAETMLRIAVPNDARGTYFASVIAETPLPEQSEGLFVRVRFVIPVVIEIEGRPVRQQVALRDALLQYHDGSDGKPATTFAAMRVTNEGRTFSRVKGTLVVERQSEDRWRPVTRLDLRERSIIPGITIDLGEDLQRRLPSGAYRLRAEVSVDGRRIAPLQKELEFVGDPDADTLAYDTALLMEPGVVEMDVVPGATRTTVLNIQNPGTDPVRVTMASTTPPGLAGVAMGDLVGTAFSAEPWTAIQPAEFTIRPGGRQNVRVVSRMPREGLEFPHYYADLVLSGSYLDGQSAGETRSVVHLSNAAATSDPKALIEHLSLAEADKPGEYIVQMRLVNVGNVHLEPSARAFVLTPQGAQKRNLELSGEEGMLLPLGKRSYSGVLSVADLEPGYYSLRGLATGIGDEGIRSQEVMLIERPEGDGPLSARLVDPEGESVPAGLRGNAAEPASPVDN